MFLHFCCTFICICPRGHPIHDRQVVTKHTPHGAGFSNQASCLRRQTRRLQLTGFHSSVRFLCRSKIRSITSRALPRNFFSFSSFFLFPDAVKRVHNEGGQPPGDAPCLRRPLVMSAPEDASTLLLLCATPSRGISVLSSSIPRQHLPRQVGLRGRRKIYLDEECQGRIFLFFLLSL